MNKKHVMVDLETLDNKPGAVILSIGAVQFDKDGLGHTFHNYIDTEDCQRLGMTISASTLKWWMSQSDEARRRVFEAEGHSLKDVLFTFSCWFEDSGCEYLWGNGAASDNVLLATAYDLVNDPVIRKPWHFRNDRCYRTMKNEYPHIEAEPFVGVEHDALDDAKHQASHLIKIWRSK